MNTQYICFLKCLIIYDRVHVYLTHVVCMQIYSIGKRVWRGKGEDQEIAKKEFIECLKNLEGVLGDKPYFGGENLGFMDVALVPFTSWFYTYETRGNFSIEADCPKLVSWAKRCLSENESVSKALPHPHKIYKFASDLLLKDSERNL